MAGDKEEFPGPDGNTALILGLDAEQLTGSSSNVSYDLRVGKEFREHRDSHKHSLPDGAEIVLDPGMATIIQTEEYVRLPRGLFALVVPKVGLLQRGASNTMSKVDPGYDGFLLVTLFNLGRETIRLQRHERFCSLCLLRVERRATLYSKPGQSIDSPPKLEGLQPTLDKVARNSPIVIAVHVLVTSALTVLPFLWAVAASVVPVLWTVTRNVVELLSLD